MTALPCPPQHWSRFSTLLNDAMDVPVADRDDWLLALHGEDAILRPWLARVLGSAASISTGDFLRGPSLSGGEPDPGPDDFDTGDRVGPYRLIALLGQGGMGRVWRAARDDEGPAREVALKLPHADLLTKTFRARFQRERDVLAGLSHPNIASLYDAGVCPSGHPYLALELVSGQSITAHCLAAPLPPARCVDLVRQVLAALGYAHARLIVHRDIKPSNVLVTPDGQVKLLDFGIAKLLAPGMTEDAQGLTQPAARLATPGYAPPEQLEGGRITVAADLFATGVLLYELCTGQRPPRLRPDGEAAPRASGKVDPALPDRDERRRQLRGDLEAVIAKALSIDPAQRYGSADAFALDLKRWQDGKAVTARRVGALVLAAKFARRNRVAVGLAGLLALALAGGAGGVAWQAHRAEREAARALVIQNFMVGLFEQGDAASHGKRLDTMTARDMLDSGADRADAAFVHDPATEIALLEILGKIYDWSDESARAEHVRARQLDLATALYGPGEPRVIASALSLANSEVMFLHTDAARALLERIRAPLFAHFGPASLQWARWLESRARALRATHGGRDEALADDQAAIAIFQQRDPHDPAYHDAVEDLAEYQYDGERYEESLATVERLRAMDVAQHDFDPSDDLVYHTQIASRLERLGHAAEADAAYAWSADQAERQFGKQSLWYLFALTGRAQTAHLRGDRVTGDRFFAEALAIDQRRAAVSGQSTSLFRVYGASLAREGRAAEAVPILERVLADTTLRGRDEQGLRRTQGMLADAYDLVGRTAEARALFRAALDGWLRYGPRDGIADLNARERWARFLLDHGETEAAAAAFKTVVEKAANRPMAAAALAQAGLARIALASGAAADAATLSLAALRSINRVTIEFDVRARADILLVRAECLAGAGQQAEASLLAKTALADAESWDDVLSLRRQRAAQMVARLEGK